MQGENAYIDWLRQRIPSSPRVLIGPGDDTAAVTWGAGPACLITTDMLLEGTCFTLEDSPIQVAGVESASPLRVGHKAMAVNLSDIAAMAGIPVAAVVSVGLPRRGGRHLGEELFWGMKERADEFGVAIVGGDTNSWDGPLVISISLFGEPGPAGIVRRSGAEVGDWLIVTGPLGGSIRGKHLDFIPRVREALALSSLVRLKAMIDISDGLSLDLSRLCKESACGAVLWSDRIPKMPGVTLQQALGDGEDFELLAAVHPTDAKRLLHEQPIEGIQIHAIGEVVSVGLWLDVDNCRKPLDVSGFQHILQ
ncbi:MAG: thiamine-phosphate kinase [Planctomycetia bacterium]|nr:thiamine-phosphate kinase [Planctomycetia bacterium]